MSCRGCHHGEMDDHWRSYPRRQAESGFGLPVRSGEPDARVPARQTLWCLGRRAIPDFDDGDTTDALALDDSDELTLDDDVLDIR